MSGSWTLQVDTGCVSDFGILANFISALSRCNAMTHLYLLRPLPQKMNTRMSRRVLIGVMAAWAMLSVEAKAPGTERIEAVVLRQGYSMGYGGAITLGITYKNLPKP